MFLQLAGGSDCVLLARAEEGLPDGAIALSAVQQHNLHLNAGTAAEFRCAAGLHCIVQGGGCRHQAEAAPDSALRRPLHFFPCSIHAPQSCCTAASAVLRPAPAAVWQEGSLHHAPRCLPAHLHPAGCCAAALYALPPALCCAAALAGCSNQNQSSHLSWWMWSLK